MQHKPSSNHALSYSSLWFLSSDALINCSFPLVNLSFVSLICKTTNNEPKMGRRKREYFLPDITDFLWDQGKSLNPSGPSLPHFLNDTAWVRSTWRPLPALFSWGYKKRKGLLLHCYCSVHVHAPSFSGVPLSATLWTVAHQAPLSMGLSWQEHWSGQAFPPPGDLPNPGIEPLSPVSLALAGRFFTTEPPGLVTL